MIKIELDDRIKALHKKYFKNKIILKLKSSNLIFKAGDIKNINNTYGRKYNIKYIQRMHDKFIKYCISNVNRIAIGNFSELRNIESEIERLYPIVIKLIKDKFELANNNSKYKSKKYYWQQLFDLFGYEEFEKCDFFTTLEDLSKQETLINNIKSNKNKKIVQEKMRNILKQMFPQIKEKIDDIFTDKNHSGNKVINMDEFKIKLKNIENKYSLGITLNNYKHSEFSKVWNAYMFVLSCGIRTCPYCNRQYITPVFTSSGMIRGELDHFLAKSRYPYFSMSLYNLVPVCHSCNSSLKGIVEFNFNDINPYNESMNDYIKFYASIINDKSIHINVTKKCQNKKNNINKFIETFKLELQYNYHVNQVDELIYKRLAYSEEYIKDLIDNFFYGSITEEKLKEILIGYIKDEKKINNEPLAKFRRDIVEQLKFFDTSHNKLIEQLKDIVKNFSNSN